MNRPAGAVDLMFAAWGLPQLRAMLDAFAEEVERGAKRFDGERAARRRRIAQLAREMVTEIDVVMRETGE